MSAVMVCVPHRARTAARRACVSAAQSGNLHLPSSTCAEPELPSHVASSSPRGRGAFVFSGVNTYNACRDGSTIGGIAMDLSAVSPDRIRRFFSFIRVTDAGCWEWTGCRTPDGYGRFCYPTGNDSNYAHRFALEVLKGTPIPKSMESDHLCRNPPCANPEHLEVVTPLENYMRAPKHIVKGDFSRRTNRRCDVEGCDRKHSAQGMCHRHYKVWRRRWLALGQYPDEVFVMDRGDG